MNRLVIEGMNVERDGRMLVADLRGEAQPASVTVILGPNGAGKSTLLQMLAGVLPGAGAHARWRDRRLDEYDRRQLADIVSWQGSVDYADFGLSVEERLRLSAGSWAGAEAVEVLQQLDVIDLMARPLARLSSGERQRVEVAAAILRDTPVLLLDEPTAHLDLRHQAACLRLMRHQADACDRVVLTVLHDVTQAVAVADQAILLDGDGEYETGEAAGLLTAERLSRLFRMKLQSLGEGHLLLPDYRA